MPEPAIPMTIMAVALGDSFCLPLSTGEVSVGVGVAVFAVAAGAGVAMTGRKRASRAFGTRARRAPVVQWPESGEVSGATARVTEALWRESARAAQ